MYASKIHPGPECESVNYCFMYRLARPTCSLHTDQRSSLRPGISLVMTGMYGGLEVSVSAEGTGSWAEDKLSWISNSKRSSQRDFCVIPIILIAWLIDEIVAFLSLQRPGVT